MDDSGDLRQRRGRRRRGGWQLVALALVTLAAFVAAVWYAYNQGVERGASVTPPLIRADKSPTKVRPEEPGGLDIPHQDKLVYETLTGEQPAQGAERLLAPPEEPVARPEPPPAAPEDGQPAAGSPVEVEAVTAVPPQAAPAPEAAAEPAPEPEPAAEATVVARRESPEAAEPAERAAPAAEEEEDAGGALRVQLAAYRDPDAATQGWHRLSSANPALLGKLTPRVIKVDLGPGKGIFYRLLAGPLPDRSAADALCAELKTRKVGCLVVKR